MREALQLRDEDLRRWHWGADIFDAGMVSLVRETARTLGIASFDLQAGRPRRPHIAKVAPAAMIFTPCRDGIYPQQSRARRPRRVPGIVVLANAVLARAER